MRPLGGKAPEVEQNLGGGSKSAMTGESGTYGLYAEAYRRAAQKRKLLPREMQSITWEAIRGLYSPEFKRSKAAEEINNLWKSFSGGELSAQESREHAKRIAGGITRPSWASEGVPGAGVHAEQRNPTDSRKLSGPELAGPADGPGGGARRRGGSGAAPAVPTPELDERGISLRRKATQRGSIRIERDQPEGEAKARTTAAGSGGRGGRTVEAKAAAGAEADPIGTGGQPSGKPGQAKSERRPSVSPQYERTKPNILKNVAPEVAKAMEERLRDFEARNPERKQASRTSEKKPEVWIRKSWRVWTLQS
ncbi:MAG: hypothetical protein FJW36_23935 [Acidobacteria bacterium]|nr:hypothetical protein [Acidobacteriota bacterium]